MDRDSSTGSHSAASTPPPVEESTYRADEVQIRGAQRRGGLNIPATLAGTLAAIGSLVLLAGLIGAVLGAIGYQTGLSGNKDELSVGGLVAGLIALFVAFLIGGWVAARIARYNGGAHGVLTAVWMLVLAAILAALGAWVGAEYDVFSNLGLPQWFSADGLTLAAIISGLVAIAAMLLCGWLGGRWGERSGSRGDGELVETREALATREGGILGRRPERPR